MGQGTVETWGKGSGRKGGLCPNQQRFCSPVGGGGQGCPSPPFWQPRKRDTAPGAGGDPGRPLTRRTVASAGVPVRSLALLLPPLHWSPIGTPPTPAQSPAETLAPLVNSRRGRDPGDQPPPPPPTNGGGGSTRYNAPPPRAVCHPRRQQQNTRAHPRTNTRQRRPSGSASAGSVGPEISPWAPTSRLSATVSGAGTAAVTWDPAPRTPPKRCRAAGLPGGHCPCVRPCPPPPQKKECGEVTPASGHPGAQKRPLERGPPPLVLGRLPGRMWLMARAVALLRVDPTQSSGTGTVRVAQPPEGREGGV